MNLPKSPHLNMYTIHQRVEIYELFYEAVMKNVYRKLRVIFTIITIVSLKSGLNQLLKNVFVDILGL